MEYKELIDAFAAKCGLEPPDAKDGAVVFEFVEFASTRMSKPSFRSKMRGAAHEF